MSSKYHQWLKGLMGTIVPLGPVTPNRVAIKDLFKLLDTASEEFFESLETNGFTRDEAVAMTSHLSTFRREVVGTTRPILGETK